MADRFQLIARKQEVRRRIERLSRQLAGLADDSSRGTAKLRHRLEQQRERLMAQESSLRIAIDRSPHKM